MKRCKDCKWFGKMNRIDYCGKTLNDGLAWSYNYFLPLSLRNKEGKCLDFEIPRKRWKFWRLK